MGEPRLYDYKHFLIGCSKKTFLFLVLLMSLLVAGCNTNETTSQSKETSSKSSNENSNGNELDSSVKLRVLEAGGESGEYFEIGYIQPFTEKTGIKVIRESPAELGKLQAMVESGQHTYDVVELGATNLYRAIDMDLLEELDWDLIKPEPLNEEGQHPYGVGYQYFSTIMAWKGDKELTSWADFWDVEKFPGKRALSDRPEYTLPLALLADGVPVDELYPLDLDRAFESLEKIKDHVAVWWNSGSQPYQLLMDGEVDYVSVWSGRVAGNTDNIGYSYNEGLLALSYMVIPKGAKHIKETSALLHEMTVAENQGRAIEILPYTGPSKNIDQYLPKERLHEFPSSDENYKKQSLSDPQWWVENGKEVDERWQKFKLGL